MQGQPVVDFSRGEAGNVSLVALMSDLAGLRSLALDWNLACRLGVNVGATAAIGMVSRRGLGETKHIPPALWAQAV